jgi:formylglycine-generating enzyme required for sulfatase activity
MRTSKIIGVLIMACLSLGSCDSKIKNVGSCGDGFVDPGEDCDGTVGEATCGTLGYYNVLGELGCRPNCTWDLSYCGGRCGDGDTDAAEGEECDGTDLNGQSCQSLGYTGGTLACGAGCRYDTGGCAGRCGNGTIDEGEVCDGGNLAGQTCQTQGYHGGELVCAVDCGGYNVDNCVAVGRCGDGVLQATYGEACEGANLAQETCQSQGHYPGTLACDPFTCQFDFAGCGGSCGDGILQIDHGEACDLDELGGATCVGEGLHDGTLACGGDCQLVTSGCGGRCGDGMVQSSSGEVCDGAELDGETCESQSRYPGTLTCDPATCRFVLTTCGGFCGDGVLQSAHGEACDQNAFGGATCASQGFYEGMISCGSDCRLVTTACSEYCGDGIVQVEHGEECEGADLGGQTCVALGYSVRSGVLACLPECQFDERACVAKSVNADLATLTVSAGSLNPVFDPATTVYGLSLANGVTSLTVTATAADAPYASMGISPAQPMALGVGANLATVTVISESGVQKRYLVGITRHSSQNYESPHIGAMVYVPAGTFQRDATATNLSTVSAFRMSQHEITRAQWVSVTGWADPSNTTYSSGMNDPVQMVSFYDVIAFCNKLSLLEGLTPVYTVSGVNFGSLTYAQIPTDNDETWNAVTANWNANGYRLPTEMESRWAAMGADTAAPGMVNTTGYTKTFPGSTGTNAIGDHVWYGVNSLNRTHVRGTRLSNELGIHDLSGNVSEWFWDLYGAIPAGTLTDYRGLATGTHRAANKCGWSSSASQCGVSYRGGSYPTSKGIAEGLRVVRR